MKSLHKIDSGDSILIRFQLHLLWFDLCCNVTSNIKPSVLYEHNLIVTAECFVRWSCQMRILFTNHNRNKSLKFCMFFELCEHCKMLGKPKKSFKQPTKSL